MNYTQLTDRDVSHMLGQIGVERITELFRDIPPETLLDRPLCLPPAMTELELLKEIDRLAAANRTCDELTCFLGAGMYDHFIPTVVDALASQSEFVTAYTPYQAEASQGSLQAFYEYQTLICQLTGMDVSNASRARRRRRKRCSWPARIRGGGEWWFRRRFIPTRGRCSTRTCGSSRST
jgi:glycine dehydrogenase subunit 1